MVDVGVMLGVSVDVGERVGVDDLVGVCVELGLAVWDGVDEAVCVGVGVGNGVGVARWVQATPAPNPRASSKGPHRISSSPRFMDMIFTGDGFLCNWTKVRLKFVHAWNEKTDRMDSLLRPPRLSDVRFDRGDGQVVHGECAVRAIRPAAS